MTLEFTESQFFNSRLSRSQFFYDYKRGEPAVLRLQGGGGGGEPVLWLQGGVGESQFFGSKGGGGGGGGGGSQSFGSKGGWGRASSSAQRGKGQFFSSKGREPVLQLHGSCNTFFEHRCQMLGKLVC